MPALYKLLVWDGAQGFGTEGTNLVIAGKEAIVELYKEVVIVNGVNEQNFFPRPHWLLL